MSHSFVLQGKTTRAEILDFYREYCAAWGYPPTVREIGDVLGLTSPATVHRHLGLLEQQGSLVRIGPQEKLMPAVPR